MALGLPWCSSLSLIELKGGLFVNRLLVWKTKGFQRFSPSGRMARQERVVL